jgi:glycosyltransferase involved in cell wall biosynthesis
MLSIEQIGRFRRPIVWTMHDMEPFSGGYSYRSNLDIALVKPLEYLPRHARKRKLSEWILARKVASWKSISLTPVSPSVWLKSEAQAFGAFRNKRIFHVPYGVPHDVFFPVARTSARAELALPEEKRIILLGADDISDPRKGVDLAIDALKAYMQTNCGRLSPPLLVYFGRNAEKLTPLLSFLPALNFGTIANPNVLRLLYSSSNLFLCPSREDNLPNMAIESLACGTPVAAFRIGGLPDIVKEPAAGLLAEPFDSLQLSHLIKLAFVTQDFLSESANQLRSRLAHKNFSPEIQAEEYIKLYSTSTLKHE